MENGPFISNVLRRGIQLDSDQFVAPGVDELFQLAQREGSETYPLPILPVHFMRNEELPMFPGVKGGFTMSGGVSHVFDRYCKHGKLGEAFFFSQFVAVKRTRKDFSLSFR